MTEYVEPPARLDGQIELASYDDSWAATFSQLAATIHEVLGDVIVEHVGSTSVPGLDAKPIIDINLIVNDSTSELAYVPALELLGYVLIVREPGWHEHRLLRLAHPAVNLHVFTAGCSEHARMTTFRDLLRSDPSARANYLAAKRSLAARTWTYVQDYVDAKAAVIDEILGGES